MTLRSVISLLLVLILVAAAAAFGGLFQPGDWYQALDKPAGNPPDWVFGPVWTVLYLTMAVAAWRVWRARGEWGVELWLWMAQLTSNALWSYLFFGLQRPGLALVDILLLLALIIWTAARFGRVDRIAGWLLVPYAAWVTFATYLNAGVWILNR